MSVGETETRIGPPLRRGIALGVLLLAAIGTAPLRAQDQGDVAEAARQARERKAAQKNFPHHVYTDDDLKRGKILTPEDASRALISRNAPATPGKTAIEAEKTGQKPEQIQQQPGEQERNQETPSLGEIARRYRQEKEARRAEEAAKRTEPSHYPLDLPKESLATPKAAVGPIGGSTGSLREDELGTAKRPTPGLAPGASNLRISPFTPRREVAPMAPRANVPLATLVASLQRKQVQAGDSWWKFAQQYLGDGSRWAELVRVNPGVSLDPRHLRAGTYVFVPQSTRTRAAPPPGAQVTVQKGDTLWLLAREQLGCGAAWPKLAAANPQVTNVHQLHIGARLRIPERMAAVCPATLAAVPRN